MPLESVDRALDRVPLPAVGLVEFRRPAPDGAACQAALVPGPSPPEPCSGSWVCEAAPFTIPPPSVNGTTSGARKSSSPCRSPVPTARPSTSTVRRIPLTKPPRAVGVLGQMHGCSFWMDVTIHNPGPRTSPACSPGHRADRAGRARTVPVRQIRGRLTLPPPTPEGRRHGRHISCAQRYVLPSAEIPREPGQQSRLLVAAPNTVGRQVVAVAHGLHRRVTLWGPDGLPQVPAGCEYSGHDGGDCHPARGDPCESRYGHGRRAYRQVDRKVRPRRAIRHNSRPEQPSSRDTACSAGFRNHTTFTPWQSTSGSRTATVSGPLTAPRATRRCTSSGVIGSDSAVECADSASHGDLSPRLAYAPWTAPRGCRRS